MSDETCPNCGYCKHCGRANPPAPMRFVPAPVIVPYQPPAPQPFLPDWAPVIPDWQPTIPWNPDLIYKVTCEPSMLVGTVFTNRTNLSS